MFPSLRSGTDRTTSSSELDGQRLLPAGSPPEFLGPQPRASRERVRVLVTVSAPVASALVLVTGASPVAADVITRAYVTNQNSDTVSVVDTATNTVVATIRVGDFPFDVAVTPDGTRAYVTNESADTVSVINTATAAVTAVTTNCGTGGINGDEVEQYTAGGVGLQNLGGGNYQFNWTTAERDAGTCKTMHLDLGEGKTRTALFQFN